MPYIKTDTRDWLNSGNPAENPGELTYQIQQILLRYLETNGLMYQTLVECLGALGGAQIDLTERVIKAYEQQKCDDNGDVWPTDQTISNAEPVMRQAFVPDAYRERER